MPLPFRWNIAKREQLGAVSPVDVSPEIVRHLRRCCARIISFCGNADLVFVGRSPEVVFDFLSGLLGKTSWSNRLCLLNVSLRYHRMEKARRSSPGAITAIREQLASVSLAPAQVVLRERPVAFVDVVATSSTFENLWELLLKWTREVHADEIAVKNKIRFVGMTVRTKNSPNTWRWQQQAEWIRQFPPRAIKNVSIPHQLCCFLQTVQVSRSNPPDRWGDELMEEPPRGRGHSESLHFASALYELGSEKGQQREFISQLAKEPGVSFRWYRALMSELRGSG